jgi:hypothetical protein
MPYNYGYSFNNKSPAPIFHIEIDGLNWSGRCFTLEELDDMIQAKSNSDFDIKSATIKFYGNSHVSQSARWNGLQFNVESSYMYLRL